MQFVPEPLHLNAMIDGNQVPQDYYGDGYREIQEHRRHLLQQNAQDYGESGLPDAQPLHEVQGLTSRTHSRIFLGLKQQQQQQQQQMQAIRKTPGVSVPTGNLVARSKYI